MAEDQRVDGRQGGSVHHAAARAERWCALAQVDGPSEDFWSVGTFPGRRGYRQPPGAALVVVGGPPRRYYSPMWRWAGP